eukprot:14181809-Alexandrium_andersonii.AAC.1
MPCCSGCPDAGVAPGACARHRHIRLPEVGVGCRHFGFAGPRGCADGLARAETVQLQLVVLWPCLG